MKIAVIGLWHLGETYSTCLAELGQEVIGIDPNEKIISRLNRGILPLQETGLEQLLKKYLKNETISFTTDFTTISSCQAVWFTLDTPVNAQDKSDLNAVLDLIKKSIPHLAQNSLILISSQIPAGTSNQIIALIKKARPKLKFGLVYTPENLRLGNAINCFMQPEKIIIGADTPQSARKAVNVLNKIKTNFVITDLPTAEMIKHATNAFLATSLSFINDIADICEVVGADIHRVGVALKLDPRIGPYAYLGAGLGFSGGTLGRDLISLKNIARKHNLSLPVISAIFSKNNQRRDIIANKLTQRLGSLRRKRIAIFGLTYKAGTSTLRRSLPLEIAKDLIKSGAIINLYQPDITSSQLTLSVRRQTQFFNHPYQAAQNAQAIILATPLPELKTLQLKRLAQKMASPKIVIDGYNFLVGREKSFRQFGITYLGIGR